MLWKILRSRGVIPLVIILAALVYWRMHPRAPKTIGIAYVGDRAVTLWNTIALVREPVGDLHYGDRVELLREEGNSAQVRSASGTTGWVLDARQLMSSDLWGQSASLLARARTMPIQARGQTKTVSNLRIEPGRSTKRIFQLPRGTPVVVLERTTADAPQSGDENSNDGKDSTGEPSKPKQEDWLFVMRVEAVPLTTGNAPPDENSPTPVTAASGNPVSSGARDAQLGQGIMGSAATPVAGWVLARFIEPDLPGPVRDYASSADLHVVAWFELNRVPDGSGGESPQYLVAGSHGGEGQPCDFTMLRVYTWGATHKRYETAYIENDLCGHLPIRLTGSTARPAFHFADTSKNENAADRMYVMQQTVVRRVKNKSSGPPPNYAKSR